jgi:hypothetical protein
MHLSTAKDFCRRHAGKGAGIESGREPEYRRLAQQGFLLEMGGRGEAILLLGCFTAADRSGGNAKTRSAGCFSS